MRLFTLSAGALNDLIEPTIFSIIFLDLTISLSCSLNDKRSNANFGSCEKLWHPSSWPSFLTCNNDLGDFNA